MSKTLLLSLLTLGLTATLSAASPVVGKWTFTLETPIGDRPVPVEIKQDGDNLIAKVVKDDKGTPQETKVVLEANKLKLEYPFTSEEAGLSGTMKLEGELKETGQLAGTWAFGDYSGPLSAKRAMEAPVAPAPTAATGIDGDWNMVLDTPGGPREFKITFKNDAGNITGLLGKAEIKGTFADNALKLAFPFESEEVGVKDTFKADGKLDGDSLVGTWAFSEYSGTYKATRIKAE